VNYSSGGGFSNIYPIPDFQAAAVKTYFEEHDPGYKYYSNLSADTGDIKLLPDINALVGSTGGIYNRIGRGIPDVSANGDNIAVSFLVPFYNSFSLSPLYFDPSLGKLEIGYLADG
jgi:tripeptidyl-peptidase-1